MDGKPVMIGEREFLVPKLRVGTLRRVSEIVAEVDAIDPKSQDPGEVVRWFAAHVRAIRELLARNHPDVTAAELEDLLDTDRVVTMFLAVMAAAGRKVDDKGEAVSP